MTRTSEARIHRLDDRRGFTLVEVIIATSLLAISLLFLAAVFARGYAQVAKAGKNTTGVSVARQLLEDIRTLPFDNVANLNGFDTDDANTLPANDPERRLARRWRYALAGAGSGWNFTSTEIANWSLLASQDSGFRGTGTIQVTAPTATSARVTATVTVRGHPKSFTLATIIAKR